MGYKLKKTGNSMVIKPINLPIVDSYQSINLKPYYVNKYFSGSDRISKLQSPTAYRQLEQLISEVNLFKTRSEVPNKTFTSDKPGKSKLQRNPDTGEIVLCFRRGVDKARTPNTCFLTDDHNSNKSSWACMSSFYKKPGFKGGNVYYITPGHPDYDTWFDYMDDEYERLTGVSVDRIVQRPKVLDSPARRELIDKCILAYCYIPADKELEVYSSLAREGLCKLNSNLTSLYDKDGYWICRFEEYLGGSDSEGEMINGVLSRLDESELTTACRILDSYTDDSLILGDSFFDL